MLVLFSNQRAYRHVDRYYGMDKAWRRQPELWRSRRRLGRSEVHLYSPTDWNLAPIGEVFVFEDPRAAMLFKLTWG